MQERRNSIANTLELRLSCTNPSVHTLTTLCQYMYNVMSESIMEALTILTKDITIYENSSLIVNR